MMAAESGYFFLGNLSVCLCGAASRNGFGLLSIDSVGARAPYQHCQDVLWKPFSDHELFQRWEVEQNRISSLRCSLAKSGAARFCGVDAKELESGVAKVLALHF